MIGATVHELKYLLAEILNAKADTVETCIQEHIDFLKSQVLRVAFNCYLRIVNEAEF